MLPLFGRPDAPALDSNFLSAMPAGFTFTRASNATYFDSTGTLQTAANDTARRDYDPSGLVAPGTLLEASSTNAIRNPRAEGATPGTPGTAPTNWQIVTTSGLSSAIVGATAETGIPCVDIRIFGTTTGAAAANIYFETSTAIAALTSQTWTASLYCRLISGAFGTTSAGPLLQINENTSAGAFVTGGSAALVATGASLASQRATYTRTLSGGATVAAIRPLLTVSYASGAVVDFTVRVTPQIEQSGYVSSLILPPIGSPAASTRAADNLTLALPAAGFPGATGWTAALEFVPLVFTNAPAFALCASTGFTDTSWANIGSFGALGVDKRVGGSTVASSTALGLVINATVKAAIAQDAVDARISVNNTAVVAATNAGYPAMITLGVGRFAHSASGYQPMRARRLRLWPRKLSDAELMAVTT